MKGQLSLELLYAVFVIIVIIIMIVSVSSPMIKGGIKSGNLTRDTTNSWYFSLAKSSTWNIRSGFADLYYGKNKLSFNQDCQTFLGTGKIRSVSCGSVQVPAVNHRAGGNKIEPW
ncbi:hypothetical protein KO465_02320 [Candidatus Micrarchaeota archaeon]|nr:hypothetical protein [Candidatus Micrarchaeota archaeon]